MNKQFLTTMLAVLLLAPQEGLQANGDDHFKNGRPFSILEGEIVTQEELDLVYEAIEETNSRFNELEKRVSELESPPSDDLVFSEYFTQKQPPGDAIRQAWSDFRDNATGAFKSIEIRNSFNRSAICEAPETASMIASELNTHVPIEGSIKTFLCGDLYWNIGACGEGVEKGVELNAGSTARVCECEFGASVRPRIGNANWGGIGSEFGGSVTCDAPSQTLEIILTR